MVVRYAFVHWHGRSTCFQNCSGAASEDGVIVSFAGRDKTSSSQLGVELGIKVNLHTPRICEENVPRDGYGSTCLVHARRDATSDFASSLTWVGDAWSVHGEMRCRILLRLVVGVSLRPYLGWRMQDKLRQNSCTERCDVGFLFVLTWVGDCKTNFETLCTAVFMPRIQGWRYRLVAR